MIPLGESMEKRLMLAIVLSLGVALVFQGLLGPKSSNEINTVQQSPTTEQVKDQKTYSQVDAGLSGARADDFHAELEESCVLQNPDMRIELTNKGGVIKLIKLINWNYIIPAKHYAGLEALDTKIFKTMDCKRNAVTYQYQDRQWLVEKQYHIADSNSINLNVKIKNLTNEDLLFNNNFIGFIIDLSRVDATVRKSDWTLFEYVMKTKKQVIRKNNAVNFNNSWNQHKEIDVDWFGFRDRYFATIIKPGSNFSNFTIQNVSSNELSMNSTFLSKNYQPGQEQNLQLLIYAGPQKFNALTGAGYNFKEVLVFSNWGWLDAIAKAIYWLLGVTHKIIPLWGVCIIIVSLFIYLLMYPLTLKSLVSMKKMQVLQPKIKEMQNKYSKNPERLNAEIMALYRQHGVNPLGGCLPMLLQMPIFVGLYQVLWRSIYFRGEKFLWISDLSMPDRLFKLPMNLPVVGEYFNILPVLMIGIMWLQQYFSSRNVVISDPAQATQQKLMTTIFPIVIGFIFYNFSSGLNLYFVVFYLLSTVTQWKISTQQAH